MRVRYHEVNIDYMAVIWVNIAAKNGTRSENRLYFVTSLFFFDDDGWTAAFQCRAQIISQTQQQGKQERGWQEEKAESSMFIVAI